MSDSDRRFAPAPPFPIVDLQVNGGWGVDFGAPDLTRAEIRDCLGAWFDVGTAALLATLVSSSAEIYRRNLPLLASVAEEPAVRGRLLGIHLEGPFLPADARVLGAHRTAHVRPASIPELDQWLELSRGQLRMITVGAELPDINRLIQHAHRQGVTVSVGHSYYTGADLARAAAAGATALTHVGNALPPALVKQANPWQAALLADGMNAMFIADGHHLSLEMLALLLRVRPIETLVAVSDAAPVAGMAPGDYHVLGQLARLTTDGALRNLDEDHLVGSAVGLGEGIGHLVRHGLCSPADCQRLANVNSLALIGLSPAHLGPRVPLVAYSADDGGFVKV